MHVNGQCLVVFLFVSVAVSIEKEQTILVDQTNHRSDKRYQPSWTSLDSRPLPSWYDEAKIGIFFHWGIFSVPSFTNEWFWYHWRGGDPRQYIIRFMEANYRSDWTYVDFAQQFTVQKGVFDPDYWAEIFNAAGARYVVQVTKHHEGFTSWPSNYSFNWNAMDIGPHRDLVAEVSQAVRKYPTMRYGVYHSLFEWFNPAYLKDVANNYTTQDFVREKTMPELYELVNNYKPDLIWSDGTHKAKSSYWNSTYFLAWLYNDSPVKDFVVVNDRWGSDTSCKHGGYLTCHDQFNPGVLQKRKFEDATTIDRRSWGHRRNTVLDQVLPIELLIRDLIMVVSCNGNFLVNIGPTKDGVIDAIYEERLRQMGSWLSVNGEAIYKSRPWTFQNDTLNSNVWYTSKMNNESKWDVYALLLDWPGRAKEVVLGSPKASKLTKVTLLGYDGEFQFNHKPGEQGINIILPPLTINEMPCDWAWTFKLTNLEN